MDKEAGVTQSHLPERWISRTRAMLELPNTHEVWRFFQAQQISEGGTARWNPLNTTLDLGSQWTEGDYNSIGVKNYRYAIAGIAATVLTLSQRNADGSYTYGTLLSNLKNPTHTAEQVVNLSRDDIRHWGTSPDTMLEVLKGIE